MSEERKENQSVQTAASDTKNENIKILGVIESCGSGWQFGNYPVCRLFPALLLHGKSEAGSLRPENPGLRQRCNCRRKFL